MTESPQVSLRVQNVLRTANAESARLKHEYISTEHMLLALTRERQGVALAVLQHFGVDVEALAALVDSSVRPGLAAAPDSVQRPYTSRAKRVLELSRDAATSLGHSYIGTEHLLLGLLDEQRGIAAQLLNSVGVSSDNARRETMRVLGVPAR
jgi:ATP-dependent Clp protease ATP-binding subunit ClpC